MFTKASVSWAINYILTHRWTGRRYICCPCFRAEQGSCLRSPVSAELRLHSVKHYSEMNQRIGLGETLYGKESNCNINLFLVKNHLTNWVCTFVNCKLTTANAERMLMSMSMSMSMSMATMLILNSLCLQWMRFIYPKTLSDLWFMTTLKKLDEHGHNFD